MMLAPAPLPAATLPFRSPANVRARHVRIMALRREGWSMPRIAFKLGLSAHSTARYHVTGKCWCDGGARTGEEVNGNPQPNIGRCI